MKHLTTKTGNLFKTNNYEYAFTIAAIVFHDFYIGMGVL